jgi:hypothetical protein
MVTQQDIFLGLYSFDTYQQLAKDLINSSIAVLFADDASVLITNSNPIGFQKDIKAVFEHLKHMV